MRGNKQLAFADIFRRSHALVQYLRNSFSPLTDPMPHRLGLATAWTQFARAI